MAFSRRRLLQIGATTLGGVALAGPAWATAPARVRGVVVQGEPAGARVIVSLDRFEPATTFFLRAPHRFVIDIPNSRLDFAGSAAGQGPVRRVRCGPRPGGVSRIVLDLEGAATLVRQELGGSRRAELSFDLAASAPVVLMQPREMLGRNARERVVVIDAGHGGRDPGAIGAGAGTREKDVVLDAALKLQSALIANGRYRVALTRDSDVFVPLEDRVAFARRQDADLFISLHADSSPRSEAQGASVYTLSERGAARAQNMMDAQNWQIDLGQAPREGMVSDILVDLAQRETTNRSAEFASTLIPKLGRVTPLLSNTHRNAGFFVLLAPDVPAVLIETGFLSNPTDERRLASPRAREAMADAMAEAVDAYFAGPQLYAARA
jgi:N-acetylmuramoyl-L-alanine amidase